jgi:hypothetical protein
MRHLTRRICGGEVVSKNHTDLHYTRSSNGSAGSNGDYWSGYVTEFSGFNYVNGDWDVPCYSGTNNSQRTVEWVGLGGLMAVTYGKPEPSQIMQRDIASGGSMYLARQSSMLVLPWGADVLPGF